MGSYSKEGAWAGIVPIPPNGENIVVSHKLQFDTYVFEYEALILGLESSHKMAVNNIAVFGDYELVVQQIKRIYQCKHHRMWSYNNYVWDIIDIFFNSFNITTVPREDNAQKDALTTSARTFKATSVLKFKHEVEMRYKPSIPDNIKKFQVFEDDQQLRLFLELV